MTNKSNENKLIHVPVTITTDDVKYYYPRSPENLEKRRQCCWWSENSILPYNAMLISAYHGMKKVKDRSEIRDDVLFLGDSGGFQVLQQKLGNLKDPNISKRLTWDKVIEWQMKVCNIGMTLDIPTPRAWVDIKNKKIFNERLEESKTNALSMLKIKNSEAPRDIPDFKLFNCIHGVFLDQMEEWYKETTDNFNVEYDGFSLSTSKIMKYLLALRLGFAMKYSEGKPFHLLGVSSPQQLTLIAYANKYTKTKIYFDSSSAATGKMIRKYMLFWNLSGNSITLKEKPKYEDLQTLACPCPICTQLENPEDLWNLKPKTISGILITLHNLFWMTNFTEFINNLVKCDEEFIAFVKWLTREPPDNPYNPPINIERYVAGAALEQGDIYNYKLNKIYNIHNDLNLPNQLKNGNIPLTETILAKKELYKEWNEMFKRSNNSSGIIRYMHFLDYVHETDLDNAWNKFFKKNESNDKFILGDNQSHTDDIDPFVLIAENNIKMQNLLKSSTFGATTTNIDMMKKETIIPKTKEKVKIKELVDKALDEVTNSSKNKKT